MKRYVEKAELDTMLHVFHHVGTGEKLQGNPRKARGRLKIPDDGKVEFKEVCEIAEQYPSLWYPAMRIQNNMMINYMGEKWWTNKKRTLQDLKDLRAKKKKEKAMEAEAKVIFGHSRYQNKFAFNFFSHFFSILNFFFIVISSKGFDNAKFAKKWVLLNTFVARGIEINLIIFFRDINQKYPLL